MPSIIYDSQRLPHIRSSNLNFVVRVSLLTFGDVALASKGNNPPQAIIKLSANCEIKWTVFTTKIAFSLAFTKSNTLLVEWLRHTYKIRSKMLKCFRIRSNSCRTVAHRRRDAITVARKLCCNAIAINSHLKEFQFMEDVTNNADDGNMPVFDVRQYFMAREMHATAKAHPHITISGSKEIAYGFESLAIAIFFMCIVSPSFRLLGFVDDDHVSCWTTAYVQLSRTHRENIFHSKIESKTRIQWNVKSI